MLPPVTVSQPNFKGAQASAAPLPAQQRTGDATGLARAIRPETPVAIDAARRMAEPERLRDDAARKAATIERPPPDDAPTGPPPTFDETPLQRQARMALQPPDFKTAPPPENDADAQAAGEGQTSTSDVPDVISASDNADDRASAEAPLRIAAKGFAEAQTEFGATPGPPAVDQKA